MDISKNLNGIDLTSVKCKFIYVYELDSSLVCMATTFQTTPDI